MNATATADLNVSPPAPPAKGRTPTPQQAEIYRQMVGSDTHLAVSALAGTGKTTTAVGCLTQPGLPSNMAFCAFNAHIAEELRRRLPATVPAMTLNSFGYRAVRQAFRGARVDDRKLSLISRSLYPDWYPSDRMAAESLASLCKKTLTDAADPDNLLDLISHFGLEMPEKPDQVFAATARLIEENNVTTGIIDFADQIYLPVALGLPVEQFDLLVIDEAQDLNAAQQALALKATASGRLCPIGDENQAIYGFSGADCEALPRLTRTLADTPRGGQSLPLTVTWRCPKSHVELARRIVPSLEAAPNAKEGTVDCQDRAAITESCQPGDLIICRKNAPLVSLTYRLVLAGRPAVMRGRDIGRGLTGLIRRLKPATIDDLIQRLEKYRQREEARLTRQDAPESSFQTLEDKCECLGLLASQHDSLDDLERFIETHFSGDDDSTEGKVVLSSVHRAKGLEAETVYVLDPDSLPLIFRKAKPWQMQQERNLCYVAATRSKSRLIFESYVPEIFTR